MPTADAISTGVEGFFALPAGVAALGGPGDGVGIGTTTAVVGLGVLAAGFAAIAVSGPVVGTFRQVIFAKPSQCAESQTAPVAISRVGDLPPMWPSLTKFVAPAKPMRAQKASAAGRPQSSPHFAHQSSRLPLNIGRSMVFVAASKGPVRPNTPKPQTSAAAVTLRSMIPSFKVPSAAQPPNPRTVS